MKKKDKYVENFIKKARDQRDVTLEVLGKEALGISRSGMHNKENLINPVSLDDLHDIANYLKCSLFELIGENKYGQVRDKKSPAVNEANGVNNSLDALLSLYKRSSDEVREGFDDMYQRLKKRSDLKKRDQSQKSA